MLCLNITLAYVQILIFIFILILMNRNSFFLREVEAFEAANKKARYVYIFLFF